MSADVIVLPIVPRITATGLEELKITITIPRRVYGRLSGLANQWDLSPVAAAEALLIDAINKASGRN